MLKHSPKTNISMLLSGTHASFFLSCFLLEGAGLFVGRACPFCKLLGFTFCPAVFVDALRWRPRLAVRGPKESAPGAPAVLCSPGLARILPRPLSFVPLCLCPLGRGRAVVTSSYSHKLAVSPARALAATTRRRAPSRRARAREPIARPMF